MIIGGDAAVVDEPSNGVVGVVADELEISFILMDSLVVGDGVDELGVRSTGFTVDELIRLISVDNSGCFFEEIWSHIETVVVEMSALVDVELVSNGVELVCDGNPISPLLDDISDVGFIPTVCVDDGDESGRILEVSCAGVDDGNSGWTLELSWAMIVEGEDDSGPILEVS